MACEELASQVAAGLAPLAPDGDAARIAWLTSAAGAPEPAETRQLEAAASAGRLEAALKRIAAARRARAAFRREIWSGLRYPAVLGLASTFAILAVGQIVDLGNLLWVLVGLALATTLLATWISTSLRRNPASPWAQIRGPHRLLIQGAEIAYLETLHGLYTAGVSLQQGHPTAVATIGIPWLRTRLEHADRCVQVGQPLAAALEQAGATHPESLRILAGREPAGELESGLASAAERRRDVVRRDTLRWARTAGQLAYAAAATVAVIIIFQFYGAYFGRLTGR